MQRASLSLAAVCLLATAAPRLAAQGFDGVIQFANYEGHADHPDTMTQITKGSKIRFEGVEHSGAAMIINGTERMVIIPERKQYMIMPATFGAHEATAEASKHNGSAEKTSKTETVAGISCDVWHYKGVNDDGKAEEGEACIAKGVGLMINRLAGGMGGSIFSAGGPAFAEAMKNGAGILKVTENGKVAFIAVKVRPTQVPDAMFAAPAGYTKMGMPGAPPR